MSIKAETRQQNNVEEVDSGELNAWRRGFTPQAEIWNGRLAMLGLSIALGTLFVIRVSTTGMPAAWRQEGIVIPVPAGPELVHSVSSSERQHDPVRLSLAPQDPGGIDWR